MAMFDKSTPAVRDAAPNPRTFTIRCVTVGTRVMTHEEMVKVSKELIQVAEEAAPPWVKAHAELVIKDD